MDLVYVLNIIIKFVDIEINTDLIFDLAHQDGLSGTCMCSGGPEPTGLFQPLASASTLPTHSPRPSRCPHCRHCTQRHNHFPGGSQARQEVRPPAPPSPGAGPMVKGCQGGGLEDCHRRGLRSLGLDISPGDPLQRAPSPSASGHVSPYSRRREHWPPHTSPCSSTGGLGGDKHNQSPEEELGKGGRGGDGERTPQFCQVHRK